MQPDHNKQYWIGVDGGGTKCKAVLADDSHTVLAEGHGGAANPYQNLPKALESISNSIDQALERAGLENQKNKLIVGMGLAGVNVPGVFKLVEQWEHPYKACFLTTDLHIACLGAHNGQGGAVMVAGTGSCGYAVNGKQVLTIGAHGFPCGDKGSGAWLGLSAIQAALLADDGMAESTSLSPLLHEQLQARSSLDVVERLGSARQSDYARLAPLVFHAAEQGDAVACAIIQDGAAYLDKVADKLWATGVSRMSMIGGISQKMQAWMREDLAQKIEAPLLTPEQGALLFARERYEQCALRTESLGDA